MTVQHIRLARAWLVLGFVLAASLAFAGPAADPPEKAAAKQIHDAAGMRGGLIVHLGCRDGALTAALWAGNAYLVHGLDGDPANVEKARRRLQQQGLYGRVTVELRRGNRLPYADNLVNLLVAEDLGGVPIDEAMRVLAPGGAVCVKRGDVWKATVKPRPAEIDEWTHFLRGPDNNAVAQDRVVGPPRRLQWIGDPAWARSHDHLASVSAVVSSGGRIFYIADEAPQAFVAFAPQWRLVARDAFNGVVLWKRPVGPWEGHLRGFRSGPPELPRRLVAAGDRVFVTLGYGQAAAALDAATGQTIRTYAGTEGAIELLHCDGALYVVAGDMPADEAAAAARLRLASPQPRNRRLVAVRAETGQRLWMKSGPDTAELMPLTLAVSGGRAFFQNPEAVVCLDASSGRELWRAPRAISLQRPAWSTPTLVVQDDVVLSADRAAASQPAPGGLVRWTVTSRGGEAPPGELIAFSALDGQRLWSCECREVYNAPVDVLVVDGLVWTGNQVFAKEPGMTVARDLRTGEVKRRRPEDGQFFHVGMGHHRCYRNKATCKYLVQGRSGVEFIDVATGEAQADHWVRGACQYGVMPANGLLYAPSHSCACYIQAKLNGFSALAPAAAARHEEDQPMRERLERGPAYGSPEPAAADGAGEDWPTYRHDAARSGRTASAVPAEVKPAWKTNLGGRLTSPVIAEGQVFVAQIDAHTVHALDAQSGTPRWSFTAGGRIDSPPAIHQGLVLFGSADGAAYGLRTSDGQLAWRFGAAPEDRRIVAYGQLESAWPVPGNVLVSEGAAYFVAGRSSYVDGGMTLYRLDPRTGNVLSQTRLCDRDPKTGLEPQSLVRGTDMAGALPDVLSAEGGSIYLRHLRFDAACAPQEPNVPHLFSAAGFLDDSWWHRTYWLIGTKMGNDWGGWPRMGNQVPAGRILVCDGETVYGFGRDAYGVHGSHVGLDETQSPYTGEFKNVAVSKTHYRLFAAARRPEPAAAAKTAKPAGAKQAAAKQAKAKPAGRGLPETRVRFAWTRQVPLLVRAMVLADRTLFVAGPPDALTTDDPTAAWEGKQGGLLWAVSAADGARQAELRLDSPPVFDGLAAARGRLYLAAQDGSVVCLGGVDGAKP